MLHHIEIYVSDINISREFWSKLLGEAGYKLTGSWDDGFTLEADDGAYLTFVQRSEKHSLHSYHRCGVGLNHLAFGVKGRAAVDRIREYCLSAKIALLYDDRYPFANGGNDYYAVFLEDPDRIKVEFVAK